MGPAVDRMRRTPADHADLVAICGELMHQMLSQEAGASSDGEYTHL